MSEKPESDDAAAFFRQLGEQTSKVLTAAEEAGRGIREQARRDAAGIVAQARLEAEELSRAAASKRRAAEEELRRFHEARVFLATQIEDVHRRLEEIVLRLRAPVDAPQAQPAATGAAGPDPAAGDPSLAPPPDGPSDGPSDDLSLPEAHPGRAAGHDARGEAPQGAAGTPDASADLQAPLGLDIPTHPGAQPDVPPALAERAAGIVLEDGVPPQEEAVSPDAPDPAGTTPSGEPQPGAGHFEYEAFRRRAEAIGEIPLLAGRNLKRLLQEDQNDLLDRLRRNRGRGNFEETIFPATVQINRFVEGLRSVLEPAFDAGRRVGGAPAIGRPPDAVGLLVSKQVVAPLRRDLARMIEPRLAAGDTATTVSERAGDVYRVWKGVRTELLGEGLAYASYHHGLLDAWREVHGPGKRWAVSPDEADCPRDTCRANAAAGVVPLDASFPSGHLAPPAHGACTCTVVAPEE